jgi:hypothetical protein
MSKLSWGLGLAVGYVVGARAGRSRYEQIKKAAADVMERPEVRQALEKAKTAAPAPLKGPLDELSRRSGSGGSEAGAGTAGGAAVVVDQADVVVPPPPPVSDVGRPTPTDAALPDPLIPPAKSGDAP